MSDRHIAPDAPDLLAALRELRQHITHDGEGDLTRAEFDSMAARADVAIAAATVAEARRAGWKMEFVDDGCCEPGLEWFAWCGSDPLKPDSETGWHATEADAARAALSGLVHY